MKKRDKLTPECVKFIEENQGVVYHYCKLYDIQDEDLMQDIFEDLCKYAYKYDSTKGKPSTFIFKVAQSTYAHRKRYNEKLKRNLYTTVHLDGDLDDHENSYFDREVGAEDQALLDVETQTDVLRFVKGIEGMGDGRFNHRNMYIYWLKTFKGFSGAEIGRMYGMSRQRVHEICKFINNKFKVELGDSNVL